MRYPTLPTRRTALALVALTTLVPGALTACGDDDEAEPEPDVGDADLVIEAHDLDFDEDEYRVAAGEPLIAYVQKGAVPHTLVIEEVDGFELEVDGSRVDKGTVALEPGTYTFYCDVPGHRSAGMEAEVVVE
ncbi:MAG TPA: plastocyanin/azurin family copper-binding protein [Acidimicrobiales bacterium]